MSSSSSAIFSGTSRFSSDFAQVLDRAVAIASLPIQQLQTELSTLQSQSGELNTLSGNFAALQSALANVGSAAGLGSLTSSLSDTSVLTVGLSGSPLPAAFSIEVVDIGAYSSSMSADGLNQVKDAAASNISDATVYTLEVGTESFTIKPAGASLLDLADAINRNPKAGVRAAVLNFGSTAAPDYRLSLQGSKLADLPIQLTAQDGAHPGQELLDGQTQGAPAKYRVNGKPDVAIESDSRTVTLAPGVSAELLTEGTTGVTIARTNSAVSSALSNFAAAYNTVQAEIDRNRGKGDGALKGQSLLNTLSASLHRVAEYSNGAAEIGSLGSIGLSFDRNGVLSFDAAAFSAASKDHPAGVADFLGSISRGGFLKAASDALKSVTDATSGILPSSSKSLSDQITRQNDSIAERQARIEDLRNNLLAKMSAADAAIAAVEQQYLYISNMFTAMQNSNKNQ